MGADRPAGPAFPSLQGATGWLNSEPLTPDGLRGHVVVVEFWTYTCINWLRTLPYVRTWADRYRDQGLVVIGVSTPEFEFEKDVDNVRRAASEMGMSFPIAIDDDYGIWNAFDNRYWPALYFIDANGTIRHHHFGEGSYEQSEEVIRELLAEAGASGLPNADPIVADGVELAADLDTLGSGETFLGYDRTDGFASRESTAYDRPHQYTAPYLDLNQWGLAGNWTVGPESHVLNSAGGRLSYRFHARDVNLIAGPAREGESIRFRVLIDGEPVGAASGLDLDDNGTGTLTWPRMYQLVRQPGPIDDREFTIEFLDPGAEVFDFTFG